MVYFSMFDAQGQMDQLPLLYVLSNDYANDGVYDMGEKKMWRIIH